MYNVASEARSQNILTMMKKSQFKKHYVLYIRCVLLNKWYIDQKVVFSVKFVLDVLEISTKSLICSFNETYLSFRVKINGQCVRWIFDMSAVRVQIKNKPIYLLSSGELKTYDHSACDIKVKIVIDFSYLNGMDLSVFSKSIIDNGKG